MEVDRYLDSLGEDLAAAAALGDEGTRRAAALLTTALQPAARLMLMTALSDFAAEVSDQLHDVTVEVSLHGRDVTATVTDPPAAAPPPTWEYSDAAHGDDGEAGLGRAVREAGDELSRTTLRLVNRLKAQAERAATVQGVSLNTYIQRAVADAVRSAGRRAPRPGPDHRPGQEDHRPDHGFGPAPE